MELYLGPQPLCYSITSNTANHDIRSRRLIAGSTATSLEGIDGDKEERLII